MALISSLAVLDEHGLNLVVGRFDILLVPSLCGILCRQRVLLSLQGLVDDVLQQSHGTPATGMILVRTERNRWLLSVFSMQLGLCLEKRRLLHVELRQAFLCLLQNLLRRLLIGDDLLELLVLGLAVLTRPLQRDVSLGDLGLEPGLLPPLEFDVGLEGVDLRLDVIPVVGPLDGLLLVGVLVLDAPVLLVSLVVLLSIELNHHAVDALLNLPEDVVLHAHCQVGEAAALEPVSGGGEVLRGDPARARLPPRLRPKLHESARSVELVPRVVVREDVDGVQKRLKEMGNIEQKRLKAYGGYGG